jgi:ketosteroid isomerase-like protein
MDETRTVEISYEVRVKPGRTGTDPEAPDWEVLELEDGQIKNSADIYDNLSLAEANQICGMWTKKKEEAAAGEGPAVS